MTRWVLLDKPARRGDLLSPSIVALLDAPPAVVPDGLRLLEVCGGGR